MKSLLALCALLAFVLPVKADSTIRIVGTPTWKVTPPVCQFKVDGPVQNLSPAGSISGTLKIVLFVSQSAYPASGAVVSEHELGQLYGQTQFDKVAGKAAASIPKLTGTYYFTILITEYTFSGWRVRAFADTGKYKLKNGVLVTGGKWTVPSGTILPPPGKMLEGDHIVFKEKATESLDLILASSQTRSMVEFLKHKNCRVTDPGGRWKVKYSYSTGLQRVNGKLSDVGKLTVDYSSLASSPYQTESQYVLYYLTGLSGYYKRTDLAGTGRRVVWGVFSLNGGAFPESAAVKKVAASSALDAAWTGSDPAEAAAWLNDIGSNENQNRDAFGAWLDGTVDSLGTYTRTVPALGLTLATTPLSESPAENDEGRIPREADVIDTAAE